MAYGLGPMQSYGIPLAESYGQAVDTARGLGALQEQRWNLGQAQKEAAALDQMKALWGRSGGDVEKFLASAGGLLTPDQAMKLKAAVAQQKTTALQLQTMEEERAGRRNLADAVPGMLTQPAETGTLPTETLAPIPVPTTTEDRFSFQKDLGPRVTGETAGPARDFTPFSAVRQRMLENQDISEQNARFAPMEAMLAQGLRSGAFEGKDVLPWVKSVQTERIADIKDRRAAITQEKKDAFQVQLELFKERSRQAAEDAKDDRLSATFRQQLLLQSERDAAAASRLERTLASRQAIVNLQIDTKTQGIDVPGLARAVAEGQDSAEHIRGSMGNPVSAKVKSQVLADYPKFNFGYSEANYKWQTNPRNLQVISQIEAALPRVTRLVEQVGPLKNKDFNAINRAWRVVSREFGRPEFTNFEANRNAIVQEINTALSGSATSSDLRVKIELENVQTARSPAQLVGALQNLNEALLSRLDTSVSVPYPLEVVQGKKSPQEFQSGLINKYRGKFESAAQEAGVNLGAGPAPGKNLVFRGGKWVSE